MVSVRRKNFTICQNQIINYYISNVGQCDIYDSLILDSCVSVQSVLSVEQYESQFRILPNPNNGLFILQLKQSAQSASKIEIINTLGELIYADKMQKGESRKEIDLTQHASGIYTCRIIKEEKVVQRVFVIQ